MWNYRLLIFVFVGILFASCGGSGDEGSEEGSGQEQADAGDQYPEGKKVYDKLCSVCHQTNGQGLEGMYPPLANSDYMLEDRARAIKQVINGSSGEITVNSKKYDAVMPPQGLSNEEIVDVLNYVFNSWGNKDVEFTLPEVEAALK